MVVPTPSHAMAVVSADADPDTLAGALALAQTTEEPVEVTSMTTETNQVFARPDGLFQLEAHRNAVRTDINGDWEPIDTTLQVNEDGTLSPAAITTPVTFSPGGDGKAVTVGSGNDAITFSWDEGPLPTPVVTGNQVTYPEVRPGVDLVFTAQADGYSDALVVKTPSAAQALRQDPAEFTGTSPGLDLSTNPDGTLVASNPETGATLVSPPPLAWDSSGGGNGDDHPDADSPGTAKVRELPQSVVASTDTAQESSVTLAVAPTAGTMSDPGTTYPLYLDPAIVGKAHWHYLTVHSLGWDYYDNPNQVMRVGYCGWSECNTSIQGNARSFFSFDIWELTNAGADPKVYDATVQAQQVWNASSSAQPVNLTKATSFDSGDNYPGPVGAYLQQISSAAGYGGNNEAWLSFSNSNVLSYVQAAATSEDRYLQFSLSAPSEGNKYYWKKFNIDTKLTAIFAYPPSITSYTASGVVACPGYPVYSRGSIAMKETAQEIVTTGKSYGLQYAFQVFKNDASNNGPWDGTTLARSPGWIGSPQYTATGLPDGLYAWRAGAAANVGYSDANGVPYPDATRYTDAATRPFTVDGTDPSPATISSDDFPADYWGRSAGNSGGTFKVSVPSNAVAIAYSFNGTPPAIADSTCSYTSGGYATPSAGVVTLTGANLKAGVPNTLKVYTFDRAHNPSAITTYSFYVSPDLPGTTVTNRVEAESTSVAKFPTVGATVTGDLYDTAPAGQAAAAPGQVSTATATDSAATVDYSLTANAPGYYAVGIRLATCASCGTARLSIPDSQISDPTEINTFTQGPSGYVYAQLGGYQLSQGPHKLRVEFPDADPASPKSVKLDYVTMAQIQGGNYGSAGGTIASNLAAAFNNHGIANEGGPGASFDTSIAQNALSKQQLAQLGFVQGQNYTAAFLDSNGLNASATFAVPAANANGNDNVISAGQHITMPAGTVTDHVDLLVAATCATVWPKPRSLFDLVHQPSGSSTTVTTNPGLPSQVPTWLDPNPSTDLTPVTLASYVTGGTATVTQGANRLYVLEVNVDPAHRSDPLTSVTLPSTGTSLLQGCSASTPMLHVLAMTTRKDS